MTEEFTYGSPLLGELAPRVLVLDDSPSERQNLETKLQNWGYQVFSVPSVGNALECLQEKTLDIIVVDITLLGITGLDFIRAVRSQSLGYVYIIVLRGQSQKSLVVEALSMGADDYMSKPFHEEELRTRLLAGIRILRLQSQNLLLEGMAKLVDYRSRETGKHLERVRLATLAIGETYVSMVEQRIPRDWVEVVSSMSVLHDVGKVGIPDRILHKEGPLTPEEMEVMKSHPLIGGSMLEEIFQKTGYKEIQIARDIVLYHHEWYDGTGYPKGLAGEAIPLAARIVTVADVYDALRSTRSYKEPLSHQESLPIMVDSRGKHFDPLVIDALCRCSSRLETIYREHED